VVIALTAEETDLVDGKPFARVPWLQPLRIRTKNDGEDFTVRRYG
jgi:hypothetical protein